MSQAANEISFGVEIECQIQRHEIARVTPAIAEQGFKIVPDGSVRGTRNGYVGGEVVSGVLVGEAGLAKLRRVLEILNANGRDGRPTAAINRTCGLHIHVGVDRRNAKANKNLVRLFAQHEKAFFASTGSKRREQANWCKPINQIYTVFRDEASIDKIVDVAGESVRSRHYHEFRYHALNLINLANPSRPSTVEFRLFAPTLNETKIVAHVFCCVGLVQKAYSTTNTPAYNRSQPPRTGVASVERLLRCLHWSPSKGGFGVIDKTVVRKCKKELRRLAAKYDAAS